MLEVDTTIMTPHNVLKTSGHVDKFADWMVKDLKTGEFFRVDHLIENVLEARLEADAAARAAQGKEVEALAPRDTDPKKRKKKAKAVVQALEDTVREEYNLILAKIDNYSGPELGEMIKRLNITSPETGNELGEVIEFNLMFESSIGPTGHYKG